MKYNFKYLIIIATIVLIALCTIQYYLVATAYEHKVAQFKIEIKEKLEKSTANFTDFDTTLLSEKEAFYTKIAQNYLLDQSYRWQLKKQIAINNFSAKMTKRLETVLQEDFPDDSLRFAVITSKFVLVTKDNSDTIFSEKPSMQAKLYGNLQSLNDAFLVRNYLNTTNLSYSNSDYKLIVEDNFYVSIANWKWIIFKRMGLVLFFSIGSILVVILIFAATIKVALQQKKLSEIKTDFINNITHELKTPLTTLSISTTILGRKEVYENPKKHDDVLKTIHRQTQRLENIFDQVVNNSIGSADISLQKEPVSLFDFLNTIVTDFQISNPTINLQFLNPITKNIALDTFHFTTAIANVLENAVKYGATQLVLKTDLQQKQLHIAITDNGIGIEKNKQGLLFEKFYRVQQGNIHTVKGLGLGLYYVKQIMKAHQGNVQLTSDFGKGSTFILSLPATI
ncbi:MAG: two-component system sensor histidine kinase VicK [Flavobacterium sp.]|jgi:two-component system sensor histidine kinase VicK